MLFKFVKKQITNFLVITLVLPFLLFPSSSYALYDGERSPVSWSDGDGKCNAGSLGENPFQNDKDILWDLSNPTCISFVALQGALILTAGFFVKFMCKATNAIGAGKIAAETAADAIPNPPLINPITLYKIALYTNYCAQRISEASIGGTMLSSCMASAVAAPHCLATISTPIVVPAAVDVNRCCPSVAAYLVAVGLGLSALAILFKVADTTYKQARVCGSNWNSWRRIDVNGDVSSAGKFWRRGKYDGSYQKCIESLFIDNANICGFEDVDGVPAKTPSLRNKYYREYMFGGIEYTDNDSSGCDNPASWSASDRMSKLGYSDDAQRYYMKGPGVASNYACHRFVMARAKGSADKASVQGAYDCCKERSQTTLCIENDMPNEVRTGLSQGFSAAGNASILSRNSMAHRFCRLGEHCNIISNGMVVAFDTYMSRKKSNFICGKTYSLCPYNHLIGGGTETEVFETDSSGKQTFNVTNYCQVMNHCAKVPVLPYIRISNLNGAFISSACKDFKGDMQNVYGYNSELFPVNNRGFSAPLIQCFKDTMENLLMNKAGSTKCRNPDEEPDFYGSCGSGYFYKKGESLPSEQSFFIRIQSNLQFIIKMALTLSIAFFGAMVLLGMQPISKKQLLSYIMKLGLIMYFALGSGWQFGLVDGILGSSNYLAGLMMRIDDGASPNKLDGCQFPRFNYSDSNEATRYNDPSYPPRKEYLKIWDTLDCKFGRAIGFGPEVSVPNLIKMILAGFLTGSLGLIFLIAVFFYAFFIFSLILRGMHIFLMAMVAIIILIYVSPITITLSLFSRTKGIFDKWWKQILGLALQPVILFAYLGMFIALFDRTMAGDARFEGDGRSVPKTINCSSYRACKSGMSCSQIDFDKGNPIKTEIVSPDDTSIYCIFRIANMKTYSGLEMFGIGLPILTSLNSTKIDTLVKSAIIMFVFSQFMDKISDLAAKLVGGAKLSSNTPSATAMATKAYGIAKGVQQRGMRATKKAAPKAVAYAGAMAKSAVRGLGEKGKHLAKQAVSRAKSAVGLGTGGDSSASGGGDKAKAEAPPKKD